MVTRPRKSTPPFPGTVCARAECGTVLSTYNEDPDGLCGSCRQAAEASALSASSVDLERLIAGLLLTHDALHPGEPVNLARELHVLGVESDCWLIGLAVRHLASRHGLVARGERGRPGYSVASWERRYLPARGFGGVIMERDPDSGRYRPLLPELLPQPEMQEEVETCQLALLASDADAGGGSFEPER